MALHAHAVAGRAQLRRVGLVAVAAGHARCEHPALLERSVVVDLVAHLPVRVKEPARECRNHVGVGQPTAGNPIL